MTLDLAALAVPNELQVAALEIIDEPDALVRIAAMLISVREISPIARAVCALALRAAAPMDRMVWALTDDVVFSNVPTWHWAMVNDTERNTAYRAAIEASVKPGMNVLEIGAGTGLLAMMAARAGATHVYTIEFNPLVAHIARLCIEQNGFSDRVTVIQGHSQEVEVNGALPVRCDLLVHELLTTNVLTEGVIPSVTAARADLLTPEAPLLPDFIYAEGALSEDLRGPNVLNDAIDGFDLSPLNLLSATIESSGSARGTARLSDVQDLAEFDLNTIHPNATGTNVLKMTATADGTLAGVEQWFTACFPDGTSFSTDTATSHWGTYFHPFGASVSIKAGKTIPISVDHRPEYLAVSPIFDMRDISSGQTGKEPE